MNEISPVILTAQKKADHILEIGLGEFNGYCLKNHSSGSYR